jgi:hypothetical protein
MSKHVGHHSVYISNNRIVISGYENLLVCNTNEKMVPIIEGHQLIPIKSRVNNIISIENTDYGMIGLSYGSI